ncbi:DUF6916 family protein [Thalassotalea sp. PLHSN55]|uniref:DUF6916 family protein n=1 Tax=Thalassotalea sp. PLHSN55 TaxID=3435888 RepID=UPI003F835198
MEKYNLENLTNIVGESVQVADQQGNQVELTLAEVNVGVLDGEQWEAFSVIYHGSDEFEIPQGSYVFSHQLFGQQELFLSPNSATEYETVITRAKQAH